jgi:NDP-sugar pyrophosphorylase family protein
MTEMPPVCILAGGLGTRLGARAGGRPKAIVEVAGEPFAFHQLRQLAAAGVRHVVYCIGHLGEQIESCLGAERFGLTIAYSRDSPDLDGTLGALRRARVQAGERFLYLYGDTYLRIDFAAAAAAWERSGRPALMTVLRNEGAWGDSNAAFDGTLVTAYDKIRPVPSFSFIDYGLGGLTASALDAAPRDTRDLALLHTTLAARGLLFGVEAHERFYEIGSPAALAETDAFLRARGDAVTAR